MRWIATLLVGGVLGLACASGQAEDTTDDTSATEPGDGGPSNDEPITTTSDDEQDKDAGSTKKPDAKADAKAASPDPDPDPDPVPTAGQKTATCDATLMTGYTSVSVIKYTESSTGEITVNSMKTTVTNLYGLDLNDLTVYIKPKGTSSYSSVFSSGDVLADGQQVSLSFPSSFTASKGDSLRIDTYFDMLLMIDPYATCFVTF